MSRYDQFDILRGIFFIPMFIFHLFSLYDLQFSTTTSQQPIIQFLGNVRLLYLTLAGLSLYMAVKDQASIFFSKRFSRSFHLGLYALFLTIISHILYPTNGIKFGILHMIALGTLLISPIAYANSIPLTAACLVLSILVGMPSVNKTVDTIFGGSVPYLSADWFPLNKYLRYLLLGLLIGQIVVPRIPSYHATQKVESGFVWMGTHSLELYVSHVIILMVIYYVYSKISKMRL
jgi:uncharacterized membrane protein